MKMSHLNQIKQVNEYTIATNIHLPGLTRVKVYTIM